ncbi:flavin-containing monooxygenase [Pseudonocardia spirodelae]|uniref:NAD(P)/FAD-dependent oxidoreductase n=1 Tax=Pseudonocardia spirodelae TaxID=3133431 RepID=A0ABU8TDI9_9PSEU
MTATDHASSVDAVIVGAGIAGLYQLHRLRGLGMSTRVFETGDDVGGTWYWNRYPGARCDVESMSYSYSFSPELEQEWEWTERYPAQPEILRYVSHVADRFDLRRDVTFRTRVVSAAFDEPAGRWRVVTDTGETVDARFLIMATGCLSRAKDIDIDGIATFGGTTLHTSRWPHDGVDLTGQRVAVIGTGSSAVQSIPIIAEQAAELTVFQRTPAYSLAARNRPLEPDEVADMKAGYRAWREAQRTSGFGVPVEPATQSALEVGAEERTARYEAGWRRGTLVSILGGYTDTLTDAAANETAAEFVRQKIRDRVDDPGTAELLCPRSYPFGTKRPCLDTGYYETFNLPHVSLVDLRRTPLVELTATGVRTSERTHDVDVVVFATGFDAMTGALEAVDIRGRDGVLLREKWAEGPRSYLGLAVAGFPNLFTVTGPSSPSVLSNMIVSIEQHVDWITDCLASLRDRGVGTIEASTAAEDEWVAHVAEVGGATLYPTADSWYMGSNVPGKPRVFMAYIGGVGAYRELCDAVAADGYRGFRLDEVPG